MHSETKQALPEVLVVHFAVGKLTVKVYSWRSDKGQEVVVPRTAAGITTMSKTRSTHLAILFYLSVQMTMFLPAAVTPTASTTFVFLSCRTHGNAASLQLPALRKCNNREIKLFFICREPPGPCLGSALDNLKYETAVGQSASQTTSEGDSTGQIWFRKLFIKLRNLNSLKLV